MVSPCLETYIVDVMQNEKDQDFLRKTSTRSS